MTWQRYVHAEQVWGTVVTFDLRAPSLDSDRAAQACAAAAAELHRIDEWLSPFRRDSVVSAIRRGEVTAQAAPQPVREVVAGCARIRSLSDGVFDPWRMPGGFDPCGYVKGWGADRAAAVLEAHGFDNVSVNAAGDVTCRGASGPDVDGWRIGVSDPRDRRRILRSVVVRDAHLATSGRYEQGDHVLDPRTGRPATGVDSATVLCADGGAADALASALMVSGPAGLVGLDAWVQSAWVVSGGMIWDMGRAAA
jgi:FAD:protein FMN transferase